METKIYFYKNSVRPVLLILAIAISTFQFTGCKKFIEVEAPVTSTNTNNVYNNDATAAAVLTGIYARISNANFNIKSTSITSVSLYAGLSADELTLFDVSQVSFAPFYKNELTSTITAGNFWNDLYTIIFAANSAIEGLNNSSGLTASVKQQLLGEAKFVRDFCYFYLLNLYGDVPLVLTTDYKANALLEKSSVATVYEAVIADLKEAYDLLSTDFLKSDVMSKYTSSAERVRPGKWAAAALLSRIYLYVGDYKNAEEFATAVINNKSLFDLSPLDDVFNMNSNETIWALQPVRTEPEANTGEGALFILPGTGPNSFENPVYLNKGLVSLFEINDQRKVKWLDSVVVAGNVYYYPAKYKIGKVNTATAEYIMMIRLAEQYLIRAEARVYLNNFSGAQADINAIRKRAGLGNINAADKNTLLAAIMKERQLELFSEWGHRWFDLKRTNKIDEVMTVAAKQKGATWSSFQAKYPIPKDEITRDPNLEQNTGY
jgi:hypothetical protein